MEKSKLDDKNLVNIRLFVYFVYMGNLVIQAENIMKPINNRQFYLNIVYFAVSFIIGICLINSFYKGMHWVKYALVLMTVRNFMATFDIEGYYYYDIVRYNYRFKDVHTTNSMMFMLLAVTYNSIPCLILYAVCGVTAANYATFRGDPSKLFTIS